MSTRLVIVALMSLCASGCANRWLTSKWAMGNPDYAAKYDRPYSKDEAKRYSRMAKQVVDARHVEGMAGFYGTLAAQDDSFTAGGELGYAYYPKSWLEMHTALAGVTGIDEDPGSFGDLAYLGVNGGVRANTPTRLAPFVGVGTFGGVSVYELARVALADDDDPFEDLDEPDEREEEFRLIGAVYPEVGVHFWVTDKLRLTGSAAYYVTTEGRDNDFWFFGLSLGRFNDPHFSDDFTPADEPDVRWAPP